MSRAIELAASTENQDRFPQYLFLQAYGAHKYWLVAGLAFLAVILYAGATLLSGEPGFPLDDSWIHQTYARNLAHTGRWTFGSGEASSGSTAPLWTVLLALGYLVRIPYIPWALILGWLCLTWIAWLGMRMIRLLWPKHQDKDWIVGATLALSWPLIWAAGSGMETLLFSALALQLLLLYCRQALGNYWRPFLLGILTGLLILVRPDGFGVLFLLAVGLVLAPGKAVDRLTRLGILLVATFVVLVPYFALNWMASGFILPNTFYAKQAEYAVLWESPLPRRFFQLLWSALGGPTEGVRGISGARLLLLPGLGASVWLALRHDWQKKMIIQTIPLLWVVGHIFTYAWRLPVTYQHGRYLWPVIPILIIYGLVGWFWLAGRASSWFESKGMNDFIWRTSSKLIFVLMLLIFLFLGSQAYVRDISFVNNEMVDIARWINLNTEEDALIATHDIGAIGYFAERPLIDLAGLISPEVIPFLDDEEKMADYIRISNANYLVTAPGWPYLVLTRSNDAIEIYVTGFTGTLDQGVNNMAIYLLKGEKPDR